jgi:hypothetical protein
MAAELVRRNIGLVCGGGNVGLMGVLADAVLTAGGEAQGVIPEHLMARACCYGRRLRGLFRPTFGTSTTTDTSDRDETSGARDAADRRALRASIATPACREDATRTQNSVFEIRNLREPRELSQPNQLDMVGERGFEPPTPWSRTSSGHYARVGQGR